MDFMSDSMVGNRKFRTFKFHKDQFCLKGTLVVLYSTCVVPLVNLAWNLNKDM